MVKSMDEERRGRKEERWGEEREGLLNAREYRAKGFTELGSQHGENTEAGQSDRLACAAGAVPEVNKRVR
jgi:hypothetical protein